jgi:hypothetical protein
VGPPDVSAWAGPNSRWAGACVLQEAWPGEQLFTFRPKCYELGTVAVRQDRKLGSAPRRRKVKSRCRPWLCLCILLPQFSPRKVVYAFWEALVRFVRSRPRTVREQTADVVSSVRSFPRGLDGRTGGHCLTASAVRSCGIRRWRFDSAVERIGSSYGPARNSQGRWLDSRNKRKILRNRVRSHQSVKPQAARLLCERRQPGRTFTTL